MKHNNLTGNLLIAPPYVKGNFWYKTVIMIVEHHNQGSIGLVLNKKSQMTINELGEKLDMDINIPGFVHIGGPVSRNSLSLLHTNDWACQNTLKINSSFSISSSAEIIPRLSNNDRPNKWKLLVGLCGWAANQLYDEINGVLPYSRPASWCVANSTAEIVFEQNSKKQWAIALEKSAEDFANSIVF